MQGALPATTLRIYADLGQSAVMLDCISCGLVTSGRKQHTAYPGKNKINTVNTAPNLHYTVSKKRPTSTTCYNFYIHSSIATIFGANVGEKVGNQNVFYFPTSPN